MTATVDIVGNLAKKNQKYILPEVVIMFGGTHVNAIFCVCSQRGPLAGIRLRIHKDFPR